MRKYLELIRIRHWIKNILVFLPLFFSGKIFNVSLVLISLLAFFVFCFSSSIIYVINDISDIENDKLHAVKRYRPLASNKISIKQAIALVICFFLLTIAGLIYLYIETKNIWIILIPVIYIYLNLIYSKALKNIAIIDVLILVSGFVLRVIFGGLVTNIITSKYLYLMIIFGSYYLSFGKRRGEIIKNDTKGRKVLAQYSKSFLDKNMYVAYALSIVSYTLWCVDPIVIERIGHDYMFLTIPILITIMQLYSLDIEKESYADPVDIILADKLLFVTGLIYILIMIILIYL